MRRTLATALSSVVALSALCLAPGSATTATATASSATDVRVGSFNISSISGDAKSTGAHKVWKTRRGLIASQILAERLDVVGLQEANVSSIYTSRLVTGPNQFTDLKNALVEMGGHYAVTVTAPYNCVNPKSTYKCVHKYQHASADNRILYNTDTLTKVSTGAMKYKAQTAGKYERYLGWAVFREKATGKEFLFTDTHLDPYTVTSRVKEWKEAIAKTVSLVGSTGRPVIAVGDYNTSKCDDAAQTMLPYTKAKGFGDVLNQQYKENPIRNPRAQVAKDGFISSYNGFKGDGAVTWCYCAARAKAGNNIDWIFASNHLPVKEWKVVVNHDPETMKLTTALPSDHSLVRATVSLP
jgi:endonuclease/exonuclease/phosphatase family metal-dependent hydrolase